jgi:hypothetical protein
MAHHGPSVEAWLGPLPGSVAPINIAIASQIRRIAETSYFWGPWPDAEGHRHDKTELRTGDGE